MSVQLRKPLKKGNSPVHFLNVNVICGFVLPTKDQNKSQLEKFKQEFSRKYNIEFIFIANMHVSRQKKSQAKKKDTPTVSNEKDSVVDLSNANTAPNVQEGKGNEETATDQVDANLIKLTSAEAQKKLKSKLNALHSRLSRLGMFQFFCVIP